MTTHVVVSSLLFALLITDAALSHVMSARLRGGNSLNLDSDQDFWKRGPLSARSRGSMPSLSVVSPLDVLRQKMMLDIMERRIKNKIQANDEILKNLGKRSISSSSTNALLRQERQEDSLEPFSPQECCSEELV